MSTMPVPNTPDTGYFSEKAIADLEKMSVDPHMATGRQKHHEAQLAAADWSTTIGQQSNAS